MSDSSLAAHLERVRAADLYDLALRTPLDAAPRLSARLSREVWFKREDLQPVFSFKLRGAYNKLAQLPASTRAKGVIASSAGNHAQGLALAAQKLGVRAVLVMPVTTPSIKSEAVAALGAEVILAGDSYDDAYAHALTLAESEGLSFIHPFDDEHVIAGQGTIGLELMDQWNAPPDAIFVPIGGGGLMAGIGGVIKALHPDIKMIGVEPKESASMHAAFAAGGPTDLDRVGIFADGVAVRRVGELTYSMCRDVVDDIILVDTDETCAAIKDVFEDSRVLMEPAGALAVAGLKRYLETGGDGQRFITLNCGANVNFDRLRHIAERAELGERREAILAVEIPEQPGAFLKFCRALGRRGVTEFNYRLSDPSVARLFVGVALKNGRDELNALMAELRDAGYTVLDLTENELAKLHIRHLVGGPAAQAEDERLFRFEFPERPGALENFLEALGSRWNVSLFHYRNHGSDYGRVLVGVQVPADSADELEAHFGSLGYGYREESDNPAYRLFLKS